jgi:hypothetical protein
MEFNFYRLKIWKKAHSLTIEIYRVTKIFPSHELYGIVSHSRRSRKEFIQFLYQARASLDEVIYFLILSKDLKYLPDREFEKLINEASELMKMINSFISKKKLNP